MTDTKEERLHHLAEIIRRAIWIDDPEFLRAILNYKPEEYFDVIHTTRLIDTVTDQPNLEMVNVLVESGFRFNGREIGEVVGTFGFDQTKHLLDYLESDLGDTSTMGYAFQESVESLEWLRDSGIPNVFGYTTDITDSMMEHPVSAIARVFFTPTESSDRWWSNIYHEFNLMEFMDMLIHGRQNPHPNSDDIKWERNALQIINLFIDNVQTDEEYEIMANFLASYPDFVFSAELPERSTKP